MAERTVKVRLEAATASYLAAMRQASAVTSEFGRNIAGVGDLSERNLQRVSRGALLMSGGLAVGLGLSAKAAVDWESAWAGVTKTVDGSAAQMADLQQGLRDMSKELPATHAEIAGVAEAAGQLGIQTASIEAFTETMLALGETTNMTADEAATSMARLANITQMPQTEFDRLGSTVVELGNNLATTEGEIVAMGLRLAGAGNQIGLAESDILAFAGALSSVGIEAEAGGSAISKVMIDIANEVETGGDRLQTFADVAGMSAAQFSTAFREDASGAIVAFVEGLGNMEAQGGSTLGVLEQLGITEVRMRDALLRASGAGDLLRQSLELGARAWEENNALQTEAEQRYATTAAEMEILRNRVVDLGIDAGSTLLPALNGVTSGLGTMVDGLASMPGPAKTATVGLAGITTATLGVVGAVGTLAPKIIAARNALAQMGTGAQFIGRNMGRMAAGAGLVGVALAGVTYVAGRQAEKAAEADARVRGWADAIREAGDAAEGALTYLSQLVEETPELARAMAGADLTVQDVTDALNEGGDAWDRMIGQIAAGAEAAGLSDGELFNLAKTLSRLASEGADAEEMAAALNDVLGDTSEKGAEGGAGLDVATDAMEDQEDAADDLQDALDALTEAFDQLLGVNLSAEQALLNVEEAFAQLPGVLNENGTSLDVLTESGRRNREELSGLVGGIQDHVEALIEQGATTDEVNWYLNVQRERLAGVMRQAGFTEAQISSYIGTLGLTPENIDTLVELHGVSQAEAALDSLSRARRVPLYVTPQMRGTIPGQAFSGGGQVQYRADGGSMFATRGTDTVPAMLTPGEYVVRKQVVDQVGVGYLDALNTYGAYQTPMGGGGGMDYGRMAAAVAKAAGPTFHMDTQVTVRDTREAADEIVAAGRRMQLAAM